MKRALAGMLLLAALPASADWKDWVDRYVATSDGYGKVMDSWVGSSPNDLVASWGPPTETFAMPNGHVLYIYRTETEHTVNGQVTKTRDGAGGYTRTWQPPSSYETSCAAQYEIAGDKILSWRWEGQDCKSTYRAPDAPAPTPVAATAVAPTPKTPGPAQPKIGSPWLGIGIGLVTEDIARHLSMPKPRGVLIVSVAPSSPAKVAGLSVLDVIATVDGQEVSTPAEAVKAFGAHHVGDMVTIGVVRTGKVEAVSATLKPFSG